MSAVLYSEGALDLGSEEPFEQGPGEGPLRVLIRAILDGCEWLHVETRRFPRIHGDRASQGLKGNARKAYLALRSAELDGDDAVFIVVDRDGGAGAKRLDDLRRGRTASTGSVPSAIGVAQEMVESWLLGDSVGWRKCFGSAAAQLPSDPEVQTGARGSPSYAKKVLWDLVGDRPRNETAVETYTRLARQLDWQTLAKTCHRSFKPFADEVRDVGRSLNILE